MYRKSKRSVVEPRPRRHVTVPFHCLHAGGVLTCGLEVETPHINWCSELTTGDSRWTWLRYEGVPTSYSQRSMVPSRIRTGVLTEVDLLWDYLEGLIRNLTFRRSCGGGWDWGKKTRVWTNLQTTKRDDKIVRQ